MIQDIAPHKLGNHYDPTAAPRPQDYVLYFEKGRVLLKSEPETQLPRVSDFAPESQLVYLFSVDNTQFFLLWEAPAALPVGTFSEVRSLRGSNLLAKELMFAVLTGKHLWDWYRDNRYCGRCGQPMKHSETERAMQCACGYTTYPRIMPAVIVGVKNGDSLLLTKYRTGFGHNALIAGFTEIGETAEETVAREVMEEAGIRVKNITYYKSQPWGIANDLLMGFYCELDGPAEITMDPNELKYAAWIKREDIVLQPDDFSLTNEMMMRFKTGQER